MASEAPDWKAVWRFLLAQCVSEAPHSVCCCYCCLIIHPECTAEVACWSRRCVSGCGSCPRTTPQEAVDCRGSKKKTNQQHLKQILTHSDLNGASTTTKAPKFHFQLCSCRPADTLAAQNTSPPATSQALNSTQRCRLCSPYFQRVEQLFQHLSLTRALSKVTFLLYLLSVRLARF